MSLLDLIDSKRPEILRIAAKHGARNVRLFGSVARGEDHPGSDVDLLAELHGTWDGGASAIERELEELLGVHVDVVEADRLVPPFQEHALSEAVPLEAPDFRERAVLESQRPHVPFDRDATYLRLMLGYCNDAIEMSHEVARDAFLTDRLPQRGVVMTVVLIGEYAAKISQEFRAEHSDIPWGDIIGFRNAGIHNYPGLQLDAVWDSIILVKIPVLKSQLETLV